MEIDKQINELNEKGYYVEFECDSDHEYDCYIRDGYWEETIEISVVGSGETFRASFEDAIKKLTQTTRFIEKV